MRLAAAVLLVLFAAAAQGEPATARYAPAQVDAARSSLETAKRLLRQGRGEAARRLAAQAATDARLAWSMTDSPYLRNQAAEIYAGSALIDRNALSMSMKNDPLPP